MNRSAGDRQKWWVLVAVGVGTFMSALDGSIVNALLPVIRDALETSVAEIQWVVTGYLLVVSGALLGFGRLGDLRGHQRVYVTGFVGFVVSSGLCGLSPSAKWLIAFRVLQALSGAMLFANAPAILARSFPAEQRGRALGLQATMTYLGLSVGPWLGGLLAQNFGWKSVFFINVPVGALGSFLSYQMIARDAPEREAPPFDWTGATVFFIGLSTLLLALNQGHAWGWSAPLTLVLLAVAAGVLVAFLALERCQQHPMLDLSLFRRGAFTASVMSAMGSYVATSAVVFLLPFYLIQARGLAPDQAGLILTAQPVIMMAVAPMAGVISDRLGSRWPCVGGMAIMTTGLLLLSQIGPTTPIGYVVLALAIFGFGFGTFVAPNNSRILGSAPRNRQGIASGVLAAARNVGMVLGVGLSGAVYTTILARSGSDAITSAVSHGLQLAAAVTAVAIVTSALGERSQNGTGEGPRRPVLRSSQ